MVLKAVEEIGIQTHI